MLLVLFRCLESYEPPIHLAMTLELLEPTLKVLLSVYNMLLHE